MDQRLLFSSVGLELVVAFWLIPATALGVIVDSSTFSQFYLYSAEASIFVTTVSLVAAIFGLRDGTMTLASSVVLIALSIVAILGTVVSAWWIVGMGPWYASECDSLAPWKCNLALAGTYAGYYFPAIVVPIVTLVFGIRNLAKTKFCITCGTQFATYDRFCAKCGARRF